MSTSAALFKLIQSLIGNWIFWFGALLSAEQMVENLWPGYKKWIARREVVKPFRARFLHWLAVFLVFVAFFQAFQEQYDAAQVAVRDKEKAIGERDDARRGRTGRHLDENQRKRLKESLSLRSASGELHVTINSAPSCDECEAYAEELRDYVNSIAGWKANGGTTFWRFPGRGIKILANDPKPESAIRFSEALLEAGILFEWDRYVKGPVSTEGSIDYAIIIARQSTKDHP